MGNDYARPIIASETKQIIVCGFGVSGLNYKVCGFLIRPSGNDDARPIASEAKQIIVCGFGVSGLKFKLCGFSIRPAGNDDTGPIIASETKQKIMTE